MKVLIDNTMVLTPMALEKLKKNGLRYNYIKINEPWQCEGELFIAGTGVIVYKVRFPITVQEVEAVRALSNLRVMLEMRCDY